MAWVLDADVHQGSAEYLGELAEPLADPLPPMLEIFPGVVVIPAEEGASDYTTLATCHSPILGIGRPLIQRFVGVPTPGIGIGNASS